jgi:catechol 2,3-dioxygenase-like lactoylglutathione lyase family enzyme|tara:strand:- start:2034 stop:2420 length:387 start_codon:yes stop_codon:yes gene_type:complete
MNKIISFVMLGSKDFKQSSKFYDSIFVPLEIKKIVTTERYVGYGHLNEPDDVKFYLTKPRNGEPATYGNGTMIAFLAKTKEAVDRFHKIALENGAVNEGLPGVREDGNYYAYVRDLDGNKITAKCIIN